ncbi:MAG: DNA glycosylase, partial [Candidatus Bathyarchaeia archaeon]
EDVNIDDIRRYFRLDDDLGEMYFEIGRDTYIREAIQAHKGLRLVRQDPWECLASYICSSFNNRAKIRRIVSRLCERFGEEIGCGVQRRSFPTAQTISRLSCSDLASCGLGFRARYLRESAEAVAHGWIRLHDLAEATYGEAKMELMRLPGVGEKVADCVCLFALDKLEAFPVDVWIHRIVASRYGEYLKTPSNSPLTPQKYREISSFGRRYFGKYAGYAQQYLYARYSKVLR